MGDAAAGAGRSAGAQWTSGRSGSYFESAFSDSLAIYMLSLAVDFDYHDLREREYPLLAAPALAERLRPWRRCFRRMRAMSLRFAIGAGADDSR